MPDDDSGRQALAAYNLLRVDLGWMTPKSAKWMQKAAGATPHGYIEVSDKPVSRIVDSRAGKIGIVLFPEGKEPGQGPTREQEQMVLTEGKSLKEKVRLVIGISPWGYVGERDFIPKAKGIFGCILGGGEGVGFSHSLQENPGVLWIRPDNQGRAVNILELLELPVLGESPRWKENTTFRAFLEFLDESFPSDPQMLRIVGNP